MPLDVSKATAGSILRFDRLYVQNGRGFVTGRAWAVVERAPGNGRCYGHVFNGPSDMLSETEFDDSDTGEVVPDDKVPDEIWAELAKYRLTH